jgi:hypothetical protein
MTRRREVRPGTLSGTVSTAERDDVAESWLSPSGVVFPIEGALPLNTFLARPVVAEAEGLTAPDVPSAVARAVLTGASDV